ncbi:carboxymuconolactone decarboxylase family protein [Marinobacterium arenosum]|uniref:carboxymuconolactone decarboxylase family protein n=1 Tax=Marinobacterium arenosum TaxID=2862496 RepID=UPI001C970D7B|nr:carboxymuconolactone decarboxylase family protein [Marinobacterium arenosum]MBY4679124.1 carboxymuconolactone decarboxylase family protein [Marinobacterium arenosum]
MTKSIPPTSPATPSHPQSPAQQAFGTVAPRFAELTDELLFGDIWQRPQLTARERSLITVAALVALNHTAQLPFHLAKATDNGLSREQLAELITHLAFYSGWPCAASALTTLAEQTNPTSNSGGN